MRPSVTQYARWYRAEYEEAATSALSTKLAGRRVWLCPNKFGRNRQSDGREGECPHAESGRRSGKPPTPRAYKKGENKKKCTLNLHCAFFSCIYAKKVVILQRKIWATQITNSEKGC